MFRKAGDNHSRRGFAELKASLLKTMPASVSRNQYFLSATMPMNRAKLVHATMASTKNKNPARFAGWIFRSAKGFY